MSEDKLLDIMMEKSRWNYAVSKALDKGIHKKLIRPLMDEDVRVGIADAIRNHEYRISPPHVAEIPKDDGTMREVMVNEPWDRVILSIINDLLFDLTPEMIHPNCMAYRKHVSCGMVVEQIVDVIQHSKNDCIGFKSDLSKYFDSVPLKYIDDAFDRVEEKFGKSAVIDLVREYYHSDLLIGLDGDVHKVYKSLKQGCAVASWLADVILYQIDEELSKMSTLYKRYCDDVACFSDNPQACMDKLKEMLGTMEMTLNPKKVEFLYKDRQFKFLGYSICGKNISLAKSRIKDFQKNIEELTFKNRKQSFKQALNAVNRYLYKGNGEFSWATQVLSVVNNEKDLLAMNNFVMDCLRAVETKKHRLGGLGYIKDNPDYCIVRGIGRNVKMNRQKTGDTLDGYYTLQCMRNAIITSKGVYEALVRML